MAVHAADRAQQDVFGFVIAGAVGSRPPAACRRTRDRRGGRPGSRATRSASARSSQGRASPGRSGGRPGRSPRPDPAGSGPPSDRASPRTRRGCRAVGGRATRRSRSAPRAPGPGGRTGTRTRRSGEGASSANRIARSAPDIGPIVAAVSPAVPGKGSVLAELYSLLGAVRHTCTTPCVEGACSLLASMYAGGAEPVSSSNPRASWIGSLSGIRGVRIRSPRAHAMISAPCSYRGAPTCPRIRSRHAGRAPQGSAHARGRSGSGRARCGPSRAGELGARSGRRVVQTSTSPCLARPRCPPHPERARWNAISTTGGSSPAISNRSTAHRTIASCSVAPVTSTFGRIPETSVARIERKDEAASAPRSQRSRPRTR